MGIIAWIVLGYGFLGLYYIPMNGTSLGARRTRFVAVATLSSEQSIEREGAAGGHTGSPISRCGVVD